MPLTDPLNRPGTPGSIASVHTTLTHATTSAAVSAPPKWHRELPIQETLKLVLVGGEGAGLTSIVRRFQLACFTSAHTPTVGADVTSITLDKHLSDKLGAPTRMQFWDVAYRESKGKHAKQYLDGANAIIMVFDVGSLKSVQAVDEWRLIIERHFTGHRNSGEKVSNLSLPLFAPSMARQQRPPMILLANKCDDNKPVVKSTDLDVYVRKCGYLSWHSVSARTGEKVQESINALLEQVVDQVAYEKLMVKCQQQLADSYRRNIKTPLVVNVGSIYNSLPGETLYDDPSPTRTSAPSTPTHSLSPPRFPSSLMQQPLQHHQASLQSLTADPQPSAAPVLLSDVVGGRERSLTLSSISTTLPSLRELENKGNDFYLRLEKQLQRYVNLVTVGRRADVNVLEARRASEYVAFKRRCLDAANQIVSLASEPPVTTDASTSSSAQAADDEIVQLHSSINLLLIEAVNKWRQLLHQLHLEIVLENRDLTVNTQGVSSTSPVEGNDTDDLVDVPGNGFEVDGGSIDGRHGGFSRQFVGSLLIKSPVDMVSALEHGSSNVATPLTATSVASTPTSATAGASVRRFGFGYRNVGSTMLSSGPGGTSSLS